MRLKIAKAYICVPIIVVVALVYLDLQDYQRENNEADVWKERFLRSQEEVASLKQDRERTSRKLRDIHCIQLLDDGSVAEKGQDQMCQYLAEWWIFIPF